MTVARIRRGPNGLKAAGGRLWRNMHAKFDFSQDPHRIEVLEQACRTLDDVQRLESAAADNELRVKGSQGQPVAAPELAELRQYRRLFAVLLKDLALPDTPEVEAQKQAHLSIVRSGVASPRFRKPA